MRFLFGVVLAVLLFGSTLGYAIENLEGIVIFLPDNL